MQRTTKECLRSLSEDSDPVIRWKYMMYLHDSPPTQEQKRQALQELGSSSIIGQLLRDRNINGEIAYSPYDKWFGAHWVLSILADLGYPEGDESLRPLLEQCYQAWLSQEHAKHIRTINGRVRRCASQEGNCIYYSLALGIADERTEQLADRLIKWQWEDGGWNCDKRPEAAKSSFHETLIPLRGLSYYARASGESRASQAVERAAEVFLMRQLYLRLADGQVIDSNFTRLHYPSYWHYDVLFGLKVMAEAGFLGDPRCCKALDIIESKQLANSGFPAEDRYYRVDDKKLSGHSRVDWGGTSKVHMNQFVSLDAMRVLKQAGRLAV